MEDLNQRSINPWKHIFLHPKETIEWVMENNPEQFYRKLFWVCLFSCLEGFLFNPYQSMDEVIHRNNFLGKLFLSPFIGLIITYVSIYLGTLVCNFIAKLFGGKASFKTAKEILLWMNYPLTIISILNLGYRFLIQNQLNLHFDLFYTALSWVFSFLHVIYNTFLFANIFRALYQLPKLKSYLFACLNTIPYYILMILLAIVSAIVYK